MFKVGDRVDWLGWQGIVEKVHNVEGPKAVLVRNGDGGLWAFYKDGRYLKEQRPSLVLIERPKKKIKKTISRWANLYEGGVLGPLHETKESADFIQRKDRIACVELTGEYEVEE